MADMRWVTTTTDNTDDPNNDIKHAPHLTQQQRQQNEELIRRHEARWESPIGKIMDTMPKIRIPDPEYRMFETVGPWGIHSLTHELLEEVITRIGKEKQMFKIKKKGATIEQVHDEVMVDTEVVLEASLEMSELEAEIEGDAAKLSELGFTGMSKVKEYHDQKMAIEVAKRNIGIIRDMENKYEGYRFIFTHRMRQVCEKYGLIIAPVRFYIGNIPKKNTQDILDFKESNNMSIENLQIAATKDLIDVDAAARAGFRQEGLEFVPIPPDPIVMFKVEAGWIIITAWGPEAEDV